VPALVTQKLSRMGWKSVSVPKPLSYQAPTCPQQRPNDGDLTITGHAESTFLQRNGGIQVDSDVEVFPNAKQAAARFDRFPPAEALRLPQVRPRQIGRHPAQVPAGQRLKFAKLGDRTAAYRVFNHSGLRCRLQRLHLHRVGRSQGYINLIAPSVQGGQLTGFELSLAKTAGQAAPGLTPGLSS